MGRKEAGGAREPGAPLAAGRHAAGASSTRREGSAVTGRSLRGRLNRRAASAAAGRDAAPQPLPLVSLTAAECTTIARPLPLARADTASAASSCMGSARAERSTRARARFGRSASGSAGRLLWAMRPGCVQRPGELVGLRLRSTGVRPVDSGAFAKSVRMLSERRARIFTIGEGGLVDMLGRSRCEAFSPFCFAAGLSRQLPRDCSRGSRGGYPLAALGRLSISGVVGSECRAYSHEAQRDHERPWPPCLAVWSCQLLCIGA